MENWGSCSTWCCVAEAAAVADDPAVAADMLDKLGPLSGRMVVSGISSVMGPVDGYLALALAVCGRQVEATAAADRAEVQAEDWRLPAYTDWFLHWRERLSI